MSFPIKLFITTIFLLSLHKINNFVVLPFNTLFIKDKLITENNYFSNLTQNELYVNLTIGSKNESIKCILKMDRHGFIIYEEAYDFKNSITYTTFDKDVNIRWIPSSSRFPSRDKIYLPHYKSYKEFKEKKNYKLNMTNLTDFLRVEDIFKKNPNHFNEMFYKYGIIGLQLVANPYYTGIEFVKSLKQSNETNSYSFHLYFENIKKNGFSTNDNKGYFLIGEELTDNKNKTSDIQYIKCLEINTYSKLIWGINFSHIYLKHNEQNIHEIKNITSNSEIIANFPYIKGVQEYFDYITEIFFDEFLKKNICKIINFTKYDINLKYNSYGYACNSTSKYFMEKLNNNFPDLILDNHDFNKNFSLTKLDLFAFNTFDNSDTNLYFLIVNGIDKEKRWILGIPFLKKYVFSFDYDKKRIGHYANYGKDIDNNIDDNENDVNFFSSLTFKILIIIISTGIVFILGMAFNNYLKKSRKKRANELEDDYEYNSHDDKIINNNSENENENKNESLGVENE